MKMSCIVQALAKSLSFTSFIHLTLPTKIYNHANWQLFLCEEYIFFVSALHFSFSKIIT